MTSIKLLETFNSFKSLSSKLTLFFSPVTFEDTITVLALSKLLISVIIFPDTLILLALLNASKPVISETFCPLKSRSPVKF